MSQDTVLESKRGKSAVFLSAFNLALSPPQKHDSPTKESVTSVKSRPGRKKSLQLEMRQTTPNRKNRPQSREITIRRKYQPVKVDGRKTRWLKQKVLNNANEDAVRSLSPIFMITRYSIEGRNKLNQLDRDLEYSDQYTDSMYDYDSDIVIIDPNVCPDHQP